MAEIATLSNCHRAFAREAFPRQLIVAGLNAPASRNAGERDLVGLDRPCRALAPTALTALREQEMIPFKLAFNV